MRLLKLYSSKILPFASTLIPTVDGLCGCWQCNGLQGGASLIGISTPSGVVRMMVGTKILVDRGFMTFRMMGMARMDNPCRGRSGNGLSRE